MLRWVSLFSVLALLFTGCGGDEKTYDNPFVDDAGNIDQDNDGVPLSLDCNDKDPAVQKCAYGGACKDDVQCSTGFCINQVCGCADAKFTGAACDECVDAKFKGPNCDKCVDAKFTGAQCDECVDPKFTGATCDQCADDKFTGAACDQCVDDKFTGAACDQCVDDKFTGAACDQCANANMVPPSCTACKPTFTGINCDQCADPLFEGDACDQPKFAGAVDMLFVVDNSSSMCQEQAQLGAAISQFINTLDALDKSDSLDYRIAVVTTDMLSEDHTGKFRHHKTTLFPFACMETKVLQCLSDQIGDQVCSAEFGENWFCNAPNNPKQIQNCNGSINSNCVLRCNYDWECDQTLNAPNIDACKVCESALDDCLTSICGEDAACRYKAMKAECEAAKIETDTCKEEQCQYKCLKPSGDPNNSGCILRPNTKTCPESEALLEQMVKETDGTTPYLVPKNAQELFKCVGIVGAEQHNNANLEQGLNAAIYALDSSPGAPNAVQAKAFLRSYAQLAIVIISDEDDCSTDDGKVLKKEKFGRCGCEKDTDEDPKYGKLRPVTDAVNRIKAIKADPSQIMVAVVMGDSTATDADTIALERTAYTKSKCGDCDDPTQKHPLLFNTYICHSDGGKADFGRRYVKFASAFGVNGIVSNICSGGIAAALDQIANRLFYEPCANPNMVFPECTSCKPQFTGPNCNQCAPQFTGEDCDQCVNANMTLPQCVACKSQFSGANCDQCAPQFTGDNCDQCSNPNVVLPECTECKSKFTGANCDQCADPKYTGANCDQCADPKFTGANCDQCADPKFTGANCDECADPKYTGADCDQCAPQFPCVTNDDCMGCKYDPCIGVHYCNSNNNKCEIDSATAFQCPNEGWGPCKFAQCHVNDEGAPECKTIQYPDNQLCDDGTKCTTDDKCLAGVCVGTLDSKFTGANCDQCADPKFTGANCDQCKAKYTGANCEKCSDAKSALPDCCKPGFTGMSTCKPWSYSYIKSPYKQGSNHAYADNSYNGKNGDLNDGVVHKDGGTGFKTEIVGWQNSVPIVVVNVPNGVTVGTVSVNVFGNSPGGVTTPLLITLSQAEDGADATDGTDGADDGTDATDSTSQWTVVGTVVPSVAPKKGQWVTIKLSSKATGPASLKMEIKPGGEWTMISEIALSN